MAEVEGRVKEFLGMRPGAVVAADSDDGDAD
jgi:hypothetical protein